MSTIKVNQVQIGQSNTADNNFTLNVPSTPDGTLKLSRGVPGALGTDVLSIGADGKVAFAPGAGVGDVTQSGSETLTNKTIDYNSNTLTGVASVDAEQTLTNKTIDAGVFTNGYTEETFVPAAGSTFTFDFANGTIQSYTTDANTTISLPAPAAGKSFQIQVAFGGAHTLTFNGGALSWGGTTPTFSGTSGKTDVINFTCNAAGTKWFGSLFGKGYA